MNKPGEFSGFAPEMYSPTSVGPQELKGRPPEREIARFQGHRLVVDFFGKTCFDVSQEWGHWYLFPYTNDRSSKAMWKGWLRSRGIE